MTFRPLLAFDGDVDYYERLLLSRGSLFVSYKLDGIRALVKDGRLVSRSLKLIPNAYVQAALSHVDFEGLDGELICGNAYGEGVFARCSSAFMSHSGQPDFTYHVFDIHDQKDIPFWARLDYLSIDALGMRMRCHRIKIVEHFRIHTVSELMAYEMQAFSMGYEGLIVRDPDGVYKFGRSTAREGIMGKLKRYTDAEAEIIGFEELERNTNEAKVDALGFTRRSSEKAGKQRAATLGALVVRDLHEPTWVFRIGSGFDAVLRQQIWDNQAAYQGKVVAYRYLPVGVKDLPRFPTFKGFRSRIDLSPADEEGKGTPEGIQEQTEGEEIDEEGLLG